MSGQGAVRLTCVWRGCVLRRPHEHRGYSPTPTFAAPVPPADETEPQAGASGDGGGLG